jgi:hypothetical protein
MKLGGRGGCYDRHVVRFKSMNLIPCYCRINSIPSLPVSAISLLLSFVLVKFYDIFDQLNCVLMGATVLIVPLNLF